MVPPRRPPSGAPLHPFPACRGAACVARRWFGVIAIAAVLAPPAWGAIPHRSGRDAAAYRAYLDYALTDEQGALARALQLRGETSFLVFEEALLAARNGDHRRMIERAERAVALDPANGDAHALLARAYFRLAEEGLDAAASRASAVEHAEAVVRLRVPDPDVLDRLAAAHGDAARSAEAARDFTAATRHRKAQRDVLLTWADLTGQAGAWQRLAELGREVGDAEAEARALRRLSQQAPDDLVALQELGELLLRLDRCEQAVQRLEAAASSPDLDVYAAIGLNVTLGECANGIGRADLAEAALRRALAHDPTNLLAAQELAVALWQQGRETEANDALAAVSERVTRKASGLEARASWAQSRGDLAGAVLLAQQALAEATRSGGAEPEAVASLEALAAESHLGLGDGPAAEAAARRALAAAPADEDAAFLVAEALWLQGKRGAAVEQLDVVTRRSPASVTHLLRRSRWEIRHGRRSEGVKHAQDATAVGMASDRLPARALSALSAEAADLLLAAHRPEDAQAILEQAGARDPWRWSMVLDLATALAAQGKAEEATAVLDAAERAAPMDAYRLESRARWEMARRWSDQAVAHARRASELAASSTAALELARFETLVGETLLAAGRASEAVEWLQRASEHGGRTPRSRALALSRALDKSGRRSEALEAAAAAAHVMPRDAAVLVEHARLLQASGQARDAAVAVAAALDASRGPLTFRQVALALDEAGATAEARRVADAALEKFPTDASAWIVSATLWDRHGGLERAEADLRRAMELEPESPAPLNALGYMLAERGVRLEEAARLIKKALEAAPHEAAYLDSLGWAQLKLGRVAEAARSLEAAVARERDPVIVMHLGTLREQQGRTDEALGLYREALRAGLTEELARVQGRVEALSARVEPPR